jgi:hypothetical protein
VTSTSDSLERLRVEAARAAAGATAAKELVRTAKAGLKKARKVSKTAKKAAKLARKKVEAAEAAGMSAVLPHPPKSLKPRSVGARRAAVPRVKAPAKHVQPASQVAKAVIARISASTPQPMPGEAARESFIS